MKSYEKYGIKVGQKYVQADGDKTILTVIDVETYSDCDDVVVFDSISKVERRIDCFKLAMVRYYLIKE